MSVWHSGAVAQREAVGGRGAVVRRWAAVAVVLAAVALACARVPAAVNDLNATASAEVGRDDVYGALTAADPLGIDNDFVRVATGHVPPGSSYALLLPPAGSGALNPTTRQALPAFMRNVLLPSREIARPHVGDYVLCYLCSAKRWDGRTSWIWSNGSGIEIGKVIR